ncbi:inner membrane-spanning protein YciB [Citreimonas salinaria]|uniref:Inner membrane-spanning protein YciB n=1 Tax=Citreimonas salinaria TaxID=321339 RepID=A0A1H3JXI7_9RHOB|nr:inner membrane-spanning protein YciB [Citreimonas salinaria]SDY44601.1 intracellular septation protein [Citreimonas salinaria]
MADRKINPALKSALELGPVIGFFVAYLWLKDEVFTWGGTDYDGFIVVTAAFIPIFLLAMGILWALTGRLSRMQAFTAIVIVVFGGLSVWLNDERFIKMKPTIIYLLFGGLLAAGLLRRQSWLQYVMEELMPMRDEGWRILTRRVMWLFFALAAANEIVWRFFDTETWVYFETFGLPLAVFAFFILQGSLFTAHGIKDDPEADAEGDAGR